MNKFRRILSTLYIVFAVVSFAGAQSMVDAGPDQSIYCTGSVQLKATPRNSWAFYAQTQPISAALNSVSFQSPQLAYAVGGNFVFPILSNDNFIPGTQMLGTGSLYSICFVDYLKGFISGSNGSIYKTTDGGGAWMPVTSGTTNLLRSIFFTSTTTGYIVGYNGTIIKTSNGGSTWNPITSGTSSHLYCVYFTNAETGYASGANGTLLKTTDSGQTWSSVNTNVTTTLNSIDFPTSTTGFIVGVGGTILKTTDGNSWTVHNQDQIYKELEDDNISTTDSRSLSSLTLSSVKFTSATTGYIGASYLATGVFLKTVDGGNTWFEQPTDKSLRINAICFNSENVGYAVGASGKVYKATSGEMKQLNYNWSNAQSLSDPSIANPVASPSTTTLYTVFAYDPNNPVCSFTDSVLVSVEPLTVNMGSNKMIGCEGSVKLDSVTTNYKGTERLKYKWIPSTGLSNDTIPNPVVSVTTNTTYYLSVTKNNNCSANGQVTVTVSPLAVTATVDKTLVCSGTVQLSATTNYSGISPLHYKWTPSTGLNNDTIPNPTATVNSTTVYTVAVNSDTGCSATKSVTVTVNNLTANAGADKSVICGASAQLDAVTSNGMGVLRYKWTPSTGLNNDTIATPIATVNAQTVYTVIVSSPGGCTATDNVIVNVNPLTINAGANKTATCGTPVQLDNVTTNYTGTGLLRYKWTPFAGLNNDTIANPVATADNVTYTVTVTSPIGCTASGNVSVSVIPLAKPSIDYVGVNENNKNILIWKKPVSLEIDSFFIYRETNVTDSYLRIGAVDYQSNAEYADVSSQPDVQSNKYKISVVDNCGNETELSDSHKTMHLTINKGINTIWNLIWEAYQGYSVSTYNIYRGTSANNIQIIGSLSGSNTQFTDYTAPSGDIYYQIEAVRATSTQQNVRAFLRQSTSYSSRSNIATNVASGVQLPEDNRISIYPNPVDNVFKISCEGGSAFEIFNSVGQCVYVDDLRKSNVVRADKFPKGIYVVKLKINNVFKYRTFIKN